eukprot:5944893-Alexandrium_andersonii.AAC.1
MSASLVGSEMCIRDRRFLMAVVEKVAPGTVFSDRRWDFEALEIADCWAAVSYTHLTLPTICSV